jgi:hypothetical protein
LTYVDGQPEERRGHLMGRRATSHGGRRGQPEGWSGQAPNDELIRLEKEEDEEIEEEKFVSATCRICLQVRETLSKDTSA